MCHHGPAVSPRWFFWLLVKLWCLRLQESHQSVPRTAPRTASLCADATANSLWAVRLDAGSIGPAIRPLNGTYDVQWFFNSVEMETLPTVTKGGHHLLSQLVPRIGCLPKVPERLRFLARSGSDRGHLCHG